MSTLNRWFLFGIIWTSFLVFGSEKAYSITTSEVFRHHLNETFIETGSYLGDGIQNALDAGFQHVYSIELAPHHYHRCCNRFAGNPKVHLYLGDSSVVLSQILQNINEPVTFWLDGHYSWGDTAKGETNTPLMKELAIIAEHPIKTHTILIDDVRQFGTVEFDFLKQDEILDMLRAINPDYIFYYEDGYQKNDVLVAKIAE